MIYASSVGVMTQHRQSIMWFNRIEFIVNKRHNLIPSAMKSYICGGIKIL
jgi:hypothetical protein